jgi:hypothetical protein
MTDYRYVFGSLRDERLIAEIPLYGVYIDLEMNVGGRLDGSFQLDQTGISNDILLSATIPGKTFVCCERNGIPIWIGYVWSRTYQSQAKTVQIFAESFEYFPTHQLIRQDYTITDEQLDIFRALWNQMQAGAGRNMNIQIPTAANPDLVVRTVEVLATDFKFYSEIMSNLADGAQGFDWTIDVTKDGNLYRKSLRYGYPKLGASNPDLVTFDYPGSILNYYATEAMGAAGTHVYVIGSGEGSTQPVGISENTIMVSQGWPRWDIVISHKDATSGLSSLAAQEALNRRPPRLVVKPSMKGNKVPEFASFGLGDACTLSLQDSRYPDGFKFSSRILKWTLTPQSSSNTDEFALVFAGDEDGL